VMTLIAHGRLSFLTAVAVLGGLCFVPAAIAAAMSRSKPGAISGNAPAG